MEAKNTEQPLIQKWLEGTLSKAEQEAFDRLPYADSYKRIGQTASQLTPPTLNLQASFDAIQNKKPNTKVRSLLHTKHWLQIAASFIILLSIGYFAWNNSPEEIHFETSIASQRNISLPDHSQVSLNSFSQLRYQPDDWNKNRLLQLQGQAYFKVAKGSTFTVETNSGTVQVLGTQFDVVHRKERFEVICYEGKVAVNYQQQQFTLTAGSSIRIYENKVLQSTTSASEPSWIHQETTYTSMPLHLVLDELQRQYHMQLKLKNVNTNLKFSGTFTHKNLELALQSICLPLQLGYHIDGNKVLIYDKHQD
ncbi:MAG: FecR family protein [Flavobacteriaceae bacterium]|nr:FecR family protein [Flavobacteriaceae bacterium]